MFCILQNGFLQRNNANAFHAVYSKLFFYAGSFWCSTALKPKWPGKASTFSHAHLTIASEQQPQPCRPLTVITSEWYGWNHPELCTWDEQALSAIMQHKWIVFWVHLEVKRMITDLTVHLSLIPLDICVCKYMCMKRLTPPNKKKNKNLKLNKAQSASAESTNKGVN